MLFKIVIFNLLLFSFLHAEGVVASEAYLLKNGLTTSKNEKPMIAGSSLKNELNREIKKEKQKSNDLNLKDAFILQEIEKHKTEAKKNNVNGNFIALPNTYIQEKKDYEKSLQNQRVAQNSVNNPQKTVNSLLLLKCVTFNDYKIYNNANMKMICYDDSNKYKLFAQITISKDKINLISRPYLMEDTHGKKYFLNSKSKLYNATNGSSNLATYVDRRVMEKITKSMGDTVGTEVPALSKDYLTQKNKANSTTTQTSNGISGTTTTATSNPKPNADDYGIKLLVDTLSSGLKAATDQFYTDLGYIYFIPKGSIFDAEIIIQKEK